MTVQELAEYFSDRKFFPNPNQEVRFTLTPYGTPRDQEKNLECRGSTVPGNGPAVILMEPVRKRKFMFRLSFAANKIIEAENFREADAKARAILRNAEVIEERDGTDDGYISLKEFEPQEPAEIEEEPL